MTHRSLIRACGKTTHLLLMGLGILAGISIIMLTRADSTPTDIWGSVQTIATDASDAKYNAEILETSDDNYIIAYIDGPTGEIYAKKIDASDGSELWASEIQVSSGADQSSDKKITLASDGNGGAFIAWGSVISNNQGQITLQHLSSADGSKWGSDKNISDAAVNDYNPVLLTDGAGGAFVGFMHWAEGGRWGVTSTRISRVNSSGNVHANWNTGGSDAYRTLEVGSGRDAISKLVLDSNNNVLFLSSTGTISFADKITPEGLLNNSFSQVSLNATDGTVTNIVPDSSGGFMIIYDQNIWDGFDTHYLAAHRYDSTGTDIWPTRQQGGSDVTWYYFDSQAEKNIEHISVLDMGSDTYLLGYEYENDDKLYAQKIGVDHNAIWASPVTITDQTDDTDAEFYYMYGQSIFDNMIRDTGSGAFIVFRSLSPSWYYRVHLQHLDGDGVKLYGDNGYIIESETGASDDNVPTIATGASGEATVVWQGFNYNTSTPSSIYASGFDSSGGGVPPGGDGQGIATNLNINNVAPAFTVDTIDGWMQTYAGSAHTDLRTESSGNYPTNEGSSVGWGATATDSNNDKYYLIVCGDNTGVTANDSEPPSCNGIHYCTSALTVSGIQATCTKNTADFENETYSWYAYVCDSNTSSLCSAPSNTSQGGINDEVGLGGTATPAGSPFHINHVPTYTSGSITDAAGESIAPGDTVKFSNSANEDTDSNFAQDAMFLYICSGEDDQGGVSTGFDFYNNTCTGGTLLCTSMVENSFPLSCEDDPTGASGGDVHTNIVSIPTAHATDYTVKYYVEDSHDFGTEVQSNDFTVIDVAPVLISYSSDTEDAVNLEVDSYDTLTRYVTYADNNGDRDVTSLSMVFFEDTSVNNNCTADENDCYKITGITPLTLGAAPPVAPTEGCYIVDDADINHTLSAAGTGKTLTGSDNSVRVSCDFTIRFNATPTGNWETNVIATDNIGPQTFADSSSNSEVNAISGIGVQEVSIAYNTVAVGGDSSYGVTTQTTMQNKGNTVIDVLLQGTAMCTDYPICSEHTIAAAQQKWQHANEDFNWGDPTSYALTTSSGPGAEIPTTDPLTLGGCLNRDLAVRNTYTSPASEDEAIAWKLRIPAEQEAGSYSGINTFSSTANTDCTGAPDGVN